jgi:UDP-2,3-diacylglucosamine hydrolase
LKKIFATLFVNGCLAFFRLYIGMGLANYLSRRSRAQTGASEEVFLGEDKEWLIIYCKNQLKAACRTGQKKK